MFFQLGVKSSSLVNKFKKKLVHNNGYTERPIWEDFLSLNADSDIEDIIKHMESLNEYPEFLMSYVIYEHLVCTFSNIQEERIKILVAWLKVKTCALYQARNRYKDLSNEEFFEKVKDGKIELFEAISHPKVVES